jgi:glycosyltransferase involved in cell wall biosynthesis
MMVGLERELTRYQIAHTAELYYAYTYQAVRAKVHNPSLKVVTTVWDNSFGRFEYNYWPGLAMPPIFWRRRIHAQIQATIAGVDMFLPVTNYSAALLLDYGVPLKKITVVTPGLVKETRVKSTIVQDLGLAGRNIFLVVNRLVRSKGVYDVLYAWRRYLSHGAQNESVLVIVGAGPEMSNMVRLVNEWGIGNQVKFVGSIPNTDVRQLYPYAKAIILASLPTSVWQEQFGYVLGEAMSSGCPIIATCSGAIREVVGEAGILVDPGNPVMLSQAILQVSNNNISEKLRQASKVQSKLYDAARFQEQLVQVYKKLI